jgi:ABC-type transport system involved in Fe-S cluster assembly fused permease/ATPase subunit
VRGLTQASVADAVGMVTQDTYLLHSTVCDWAADLLGPPWYRWG